MSSLSRVRGSISTYTPSLPRFSMSFPRAREYFLHCAGTEKVVAVFPACAGVFPYT